MNDPTHPVVPWTLRPASPMHASRRTLLRLGLVTMGGILPSIAATPQDAASGTLNGALFDGVSLGSWQPVPFGGEGDVRVDDGRIVLERGNDLTAIVWRGALPPASYRLTLEAMRIDGTDFFCGLTFPVAGSHCTFVVGGWGGNLIGLSNLDGFDASENETATGRRLENGRWYRLGVDVWPGSLRATLDDEVMAFIDTTGRRIDVRAEMAPCRPLGIASFRTTAAVRAVTCAPLGVR